MLTTSSHGGGAVPHPQLQSHVPPKATSWKVVGSELLQPIDMPFHAGSSSYSDWHCELYRVAVRAGVALILE